MHSGARRDLRRARTGSARRAWLAAVFWLAAAAAPVWAQTPIDSARLTAPTDRYGHAVLGDAIEWGALEVVAGGVAQTFTLPKDHVFEDIAARLVDLDLDGQADAVMVVETDMALGGALALYGPKGKIAETPHIGRSFRWLAPVGAADLDGDGQVELAYIDRPHLAKTLRIWRYAAGGLTEVATQPGLTNHRIGEDFISGGLRDCGAGPEMITADARWSRVMASQFAAGAVTTREIAVFSGPASFAAALACR